LSEQIKLETPEQGDSVASVTNPRLNGMIAALNITNFPDNIRSNDVGNGWFVWATDANGSCIAMTFQPKP
jgi:hypothetical protein